MIAALLAVLLAPAPAAARSRRRAPPPPEPTMTIVSRAIQPGELLLVVAQDNSARLPPRATLRGRPLEFFPTASTGTWLAFAALDLDAPLGPAGLRATLRDARGRSFSRVEDLTVTSATFRTKFLPGPTRPSPAERAEAELDKLHDLFSADEPKPLFDGNFVAPIAHARAAGFGARRVAGRHALAPRSGEIIAARRGAPVRAPQAGRVAMAGTLYFSGRTVVIDHGLGLTTVYTHLSRVLVKKDDLVRRGQIIGRVGATGRVPGRARLFWAVRLSGARVDPGSLTALDLDAFLHPRPADALRRSPDCAREDLPPPTRWGRARAGLRARLRPLKAAYAPGERVSLLIELQNVSRRNLFLDFVRDAAARPVVLGLNGPPVPFSALASSATTRVRTEQVKIPPRRALCFSQDMDASGPLIAGAAPSYALVYATDNLYASTSTARPGIWRGRVSCPAAAVSVSTQDADSFVPFGEAP